MDDLKHLTNKHSLLQLSAVMNKLIKAIRANKAQQSAGAKSYAKSESNSTVHHESSVCKESEYLVQQCLSNNRQLSQLAFQSFVRLVEEGTLDTAVVMSMCLSMVPGASRLHMVTLSETVVTLMLLDLKQRGADYVCPFGLMTPQHPLIALFQKVDTNVADLVGKINNIGRHHDREIRRHSSEFLRPVFLFVFCSPNRIADTGSLWIQLLEQSKTSLPAQQLVIEILGWCNISNDDTILQTTSMLIDTIECFKSNPDLAALTYELCVYLANILPELIVHGYDPRPALALIGGLLQSTSAATVTPYLNVLLVSLCHSVPVIAPAYLTDLCRVLRHICLTAHGGNAITLRMLLSALVNWIANPQLLREDCLSHLHALVRHVTGEKWRQRDIVATPDDMRVRYFHPAIALSVDMAEHSERLCALTVSTPAGLSELRAFAELGRLRPHFCTKIISYLRALFLLETDDAEDSVYVAETLLQIVRTNTNVSIEVFMTWLYRTLHEPNGKRLLFLLRGLTVFGGVKENIPKVIGVLRSLGQSSTGRLRPLILELYLSLWKGEDRTFVYLKNELTSAVKQADWELSVTRAKTIQEICQRKPSKHGTEFIVHLSNILNTCTDADGETATVIALQTIVGLCSSQTINIASTWSALHELFKSEKRIRPLIVQCEFYGQVPHLVSPTADYEKCLDEALQTLWTLIVSSPHVELKVAALQALKNYDHKTLTLAHVPVAFHPKPKATTVAKTATTPTDSSCAPPMEADEPEPPVNGDFWPHLLQLCDNSAVALAASSLINHFIQSELRTYRQHMYILAEGHVEPLTYNRLPGSVQSPLRAILHALRLEANKQPYLRDQHTIRYALRTLAFDLPKPLPPLNWFFLVELMNADASDQEIRNFCVRIVTHQQLHSESARQIVENYFAAFEPAEVSDEELRQCVRLFGDAGRGLLPSTVDSWMNAVAEVALAEGRGESGFPNGCLLGNLMDSCAKLFAHGNADVHENYGTVVDKLHQYYEKFAADSPMFQKLSDIFVHFSEAMVLRVMRPKGWQSLINADQWRKQLLMTGYLANANTNTSNSLMRLNEVIQNTPTEHHRILFTTLDTAIRSCPHERDAAAWTMYNLCFINGLLIPLADGQIQIEKAVLHLRVVFSVCVLRAGFDRLTSEQDDDWRLKMFPESLLHMVTQVDEWREFESRIYQNLYYVYASARDGLPSAYSDVIRSMLMCARNQPYFKQNAVWKKIVGLRK